MKKEDLQKKRSLIHPENATRIFKGVAGPTNKRSWRGRLYEIIFEADTPAGYRFDVLLLWLILLSIVAVMLESVPEVRASWHTELIWIEWITTIIFTVEYIVRLIIVRRPIVYAKSFFGVVDLLAVIPTYVALVFSGTQALAVVRVLRVLRVFRLFKLSQFVGEAEQLTTALAASFRKITVFLGVVVTLVTILGALMYLIEPASAGFDSIPRSMYWAVVTLTTVGYGDIAPGTALGQAVAALIMILGYSIIAVPTGIVSAEMTRTMNKKEVNTQTCPSCLETGRDLDAKHCKHCGESMKHE